MIKHLPIVPRLQPGKPYYQLTVYYMIGDADGNTTEQTILSVDNILIEPVCKALDKLKPTKGSWGICLSPDDMDDHFKEGQITEEECDLFKKIMDYDYRVMDDTELEKFLDEFGNVFRRETEYSFLVYEYYRLTYFDENGVEFDTEFVDV